MEPSARATQASPVERATRPHKRFWRCCRLGADALSRKAVEMALAGDGVALRLCLDRIAPPRKDSPVEFTLPPMANARDAAEAAAAVLEAVSMGDLTPTEAVQIMSLIDAFRRLLEVSELEARIAALEGQ